MNTEPIEIANADHSAAIDAESEYRKRHGSSSLLLHAGGGRVGLYICEHHDDSGAVLVELCTHAELPVTADEFKTKFYLVFMDEAVFYFGSPEAQATAQRQLDAHLAASRYCIEQDRLARSLPN